MNSEEFKNTARYAEILQALKDLSADIHDDFECTHIDADDYVIEVLNLVGLNELATAYDKVGKWYA